MNINGGIYLIIDPKIDLNKLLNQLKTILELNISAIQIWDNSVNQDTIHNLIGSVCDIAIPKKIPVLINNKWEYLVTYNLSGVHFDEIPENINAIRHEINRPFITGLTCNNDLSKVYWAAKNNFTYISFCSMFPSQTATSCELVNFDTIKEARKIFKNPIFLAGGIKPDNLNLLKGLPFDGIATVSGILNSTNPVKELKMYLNQLKDETP